MASIADTAAAEMPSWMVVRGQRKRYLQQTTGAGAECASAGLSSFRSWVASEAERTRSVS
eukprot:6374012-Heterocapsa_arctica.AAC.1